MSIKISPQLLVLVTLDFAAGGAPVQYLDGNWRLGRQELFALGRYGNKTNEE